MIWPFNIKKREGKTYLNYLGNKPTFDFTLENVIVDAKNVIIAKQDFSKYCLKYFYYFSPAFSLRIPYNTDFYKQKLSSSLQLLLESK